MKTAPSYLKHHFLIAMPHMADPNFAQTVTYLVEHNEQGAMGLVINRPNGLNLADVLEQLRPDEPPPALCQSLPIFAGGPVQTDRGFVLHRPVGDWQSSIDVGNGLALTSSRDVLQSLGNDNEPDDVLVTLGYAGWAAGQLEQELMDNAWLTVPADLAIVFDLPPEERLVAAMQKLGVDFANLSEVAGHA